jgi:hypothetical protein
MIQWWLILLIAFLILWIFLGGRHHEFVGLKPLFSNDPLPQDPMTINPFIMNHLKGRFSGSIVRSEKETQEVSIRNESKEEASTIPLYEECSYDTFVQKKDENNKVPEWTKETRRLNPAKDKKRVSELLQMNMPVNLKSKWKYQNICCKVLEEIYKKPFTSSRPGWLKNPETGGILEIDCYNEDLKIGVEYNGIQHYRYPNIFHKTYDDFIKQVRRDQYKHKKCDEQGVYLITVPYNVPQEKIRDYILHYLPENVSRRLDETKMEKRTESPEQICMEDVKESDCNVPTTTTYQEYLA